MIVTRLSVTRALLVACLARFHGRLAVVVVLVGTPAFAGGQTTLPTLRIDAPASLESVAEQVDRFPVARLATAMTLAGLTQAGPPIDVLLIAESSDLAPQHADVDLRFRRRQAEPRRLVS